MSPPRKFLGGGLGGGGLGGGGRGWGRPAWRVNHLVWARLPPPPERPNHPPLSVVVRGRACSSHSLLIAFYFLDIINLHRTPHQHWHTSLFHNTSTSIEKCSSLLIPFFLHYLTTQYSNPYPKLTPLCHPLALCSPPNSLMI